MIYCRVWSSLDDHLGMTTQEFVHADCINYLKTLPDKHIDLVVTSPPYNLDMSYGVYNDKLPAEAYLTWTTEWVTEVSRTLKSDGSFFLNVGSSSSNPWISIDIANIVRKHLILQNHVVWVKSITVGENSQGHFKPRNSYRYLNHTHEDIYHFTHTGEVPIDRLAIGVPFADKSNIKRWGHAKDKRCRGDCWFIPYKTIQSKLQRGLHPAPYPSELPEWCIRLHGRDKCNLVVDPFGGIGNTAIACKRLQVNCVCVDLDSSYIHVGQELLSSIKNEIP